MGIITSFQEVFLHKLTQVTCGRSFPFQAAAGVAVNILRLGFDRYYIFLFSKLPLAISCNLIDSSSKFVFLYFKEKNPNSLGGLIRQETDCHLFLLCSQRQKVHSSCHRTIISTIQILTHENWNGSSMWKLRFFFSRENTYTNCRGRTEKSVACSGERGDFSHATQVLQVSWVRIHTDFLLLSPLSILSRDHLIWSFL